MKWRPIKTAPRDGTKVLVCYANKYIATDWYPFRHLDEPTHWMPLPEPPKVRKKKVKP